MRIGGAETPIFPPLDHFEEEFVLEGLRIELQIFRLTVSVVKDAAGLHLLNPFRRKIGAGLQVVIVVCRDRQ
jgi:hypothetical protein